MSSLSECLKLDKKLRETKTLIKCKLKIKPKNAIKAIKFTF